jgi:uncharacterized repeat protein (TIGR01451 family)
MSIHKLTLTNLANARSRIIVTLLAAVLALAISGHALADPVPPESNLQVFCFRITDIQRVAGDPGNDRFRFEFESLNWTNDAAAGVYIALNEGTGAVIGSAPFFAGADIDADGRPLVLLDVNGDGTINDADLEDVNGNGLLDPGEDINGNGRLDNDPIPGNVNPSNTWTVASSSSTAIRWEAGTPIPSVDLLGGGGGVPLQPGDPEIAFMQFTNPADPSTVIVETIDDGPNVQDGFVIEVDDLDPGETISFNWFLLNADGNIIEAPTFEGVNPYAFGVVNLTSLAGNVIPPPVFAGNTGFSQSPLIFFDSVYVVPNPANFAAEFGAALTATFVNPSDNLFGVPVTTQLLNPLVIDFDNDAAGNPIPDRTLIGEQYAAWGVHITPVYFTGSRLTCYQGYTSGTFPNYLVTFTAAEADPVNCQAPTLGRNEVLTVNLDFPASSASIEGYTDITAIDGDRLRMQAFDAAGNLVDENAVLCTNTPNPNPPPAFIEGTCRPSVSGSGIRSLRVFPREDLMDALDNLVITKEAVQPKPKLIVIKHVVNDNGGTAAAADFTMTVTGTNASPASFPGAEAVGTTVMLDAGAYSIGEIGPAGYAMSLSPDCAGVIADGETKICTVTNDDIQPKLIVVKHVVNDNGGTAVAADFTMNVTGTNANPASFPGAESPGTMVALDAGNYNVTESGPSGYAMTFSADCAGTIAIGETRTCTVTNDDVQPKLTVVKVVKNDNGGVKQVSDFPLFVSGAPVNSGQANGFNAGAYTVTETGQPGYAASFSGDCDATGNVTLAVGDDKTCTLTNDDIPPKLIVIKHVVNDNGGTATAADFTMSVTGTNVSPASFPGAESPGTMAALDAGNYNVTESGPGGYAMTFSADCAGTIAIGETRTCTVTNDDVQPKLIVIKHVVNDNSGAAVAADFTMTVTGTNVSPASFLGEELPGTAVTLDAGAYSVTESGPSGYTMSLAADCAGIIALGETKTCTVTNDDVEAPPDLVIEKSDGRDTVQASDTLTYTLTISNVGAQTATGVIVTDMLPALTTFVAASDGGSESGGMVTWPAFDLAAGANVTRTLTVRVDDNLLSARVRDTRTWKRGSLAITFSTPEHYSGCGSATIVNTAAVADDGTHGADPTPDNNTARDTDRVVASDVIWTTGVPATWRLVGWVRVEYLTDSGRRLIREYRIRQTGDLTLTVAYPPVSQWPVMSNGVAEIHVDLAIEVYDSGGRSVRWVGGDRLRAPGTLGPGQDWDVWCRVSVR